MSDSETERVLLGYSSRRWVEGAETGQVQARLMIMEVLKS